MLQPADAAFLDRLTKALPQGTLRPAEPRYLEEPRGRWLGLAGAVVLPRSVQEVSQIVRLCNDASVGIVPWGGGTGSRARG